MPTQTATATGPDQDLAEQKMQQLRELFADAPDVTRAALENVLGGLASDVSASPPPTTRTHGTAIQSSRFRADAPRRQQTTN